MRNLPNSMLGIAIILAMTTTARCQQTGAEISPQATRIDEDRALEERALSLLRRAAKSEDGLVRSNALEALVKLGDEEDLPLLREAVVSEAPLVRYAGCVALGVARDKKSLRALERVMDADSDPRVRLAAAFAVVRCGRLDAAQFLVDTLNDHPDEKMRSDAAYLIGELGDPKAARRLAIAAWRETEGEVTLQIEAAQAKLGDRAKREKLIQYALKGDAVTVLLALQSLAEIAEPAAEQALAYRLTNRADYLQSQLLAARGLGEIGSDKGYELAMKSLSYSAKDENETMQVRSNAALALGAIGKRAALAALRNAAENERDARTQVAACYAICRILNK